MIEGRVHIHDAYGLDTPGTYGASTNNAAFTLNPQGLPWQLVTSTSTGTSGVIDPTQLTDAARAADFTSMSLPDLRTTSDGYALLQSGDGDPKIFATPSTLSALVSPGVTKSSTTRLNASGQTIESDQPLSGGNGADQGSTITIYYEPQMPGACGTSPEFDGEVCTVGPSPTATSPTVGSVTGTTTTRYDWNLASETTTQSVAGTSEHVTRTTHDESGRETSSTTLDAVAGDVVVPPTVTAYSPINGLVVSVSEVASVRTRGDTLTGWARTLSSLLTAYDTNGRVASSTDANGATTTTRYDVDSRVASVHEPVTGVAGGITTCLTYNGLDASGNVELRGLATAQAIASGPNCNGANVEHFAASADANGSTTTLTYPGSVTATSTYDTTGSPTSLNYRDPSGTLSGFSFTQITNAFGEVVNQTSPESSQNFSYDGAARLIGVGDAVTNAGSTSCTTRAYTLDLDGNRTAFANAATPANPDGSCPTSSAAPATSTSRFDAGSGTGGSDRIISSTWATTTGSYAYDVLGRQTSVPGIDTGTGGGAGTSPITSTYRSDDQIATFRQGPANQAFTYDPAGNLWTTTTTQGDQPQLTSGTTTNYYAGGSSPAWTTSDTSTTSFFDGLTASNALNVTSGPSTTSPCLEGRTNSCSLNISNLGGSIVATIALNTNDSGTISVIGYSEQTEFGQPRSLAEQTTTSPVYGWLGTHQKPANNLSGLVLMGVRVYNPTTGAFTSGLCRIAKGDPLLYPGRCLVPGAAYRKLQQQIFDSRFHKEFPWANTVGRYIIAGTITAAGIAGVSAICGVTAGVGCLAAGIAIGAAGAAAKYASLTAGTRKFRWGQLGLRATYGAAWGAFAYPWKMFLETLGGIGGVWKLIRG